MKHINAGFTLIEFSPACAGDAGSGLLALSAMTSDPQVDSEYLPSTCQ